ncbi:MAG: polyphosphate kinase 1 [Candidatus Binatus sp.]|jgi:polyphosphate kinase|uniref:polyphosphate kinase 1 n=1 Tax=Candidatus Binatus sp. TaxID=2811406 RepID=UPI003D0D9D10
MANQADSPAIVAATSAPDVPAPQNGGVVDPSAVLTVVDGSVSAAEKAPAPRIDKDLTSPDLFLNRELTWLAFNRRVLHEAEDERNPLLERLKFLAITASNLDEFFMKRIGGLKQQVVAGMHELTVDGRTPQQQIAECYLVVRELEQRQRELGPRILSQLENYGIRVRLYASLSADERKSIREYYYKNIFPLVTPQAMDPAHPFPFVSNLSLNLLVTARYQNDSDPLMARVKVPIGFGIPRFLRVGNQSDFVRLEDVVANNLDLLFPSMLIDSYELFRVTRNANTERDEDEADDLLALIESELRDRRFAPIVRLEVLSGINPVHRGMLAAELGLDERADVFEVDEMLSMRDLGELAAIDAPALHDPPHHPVDHPRLTVGRSIFHVIRDAGSFLLLHPYESFSTSVERFLREAADDPKVRAIKMTLYRTSPDSKIISYLCDAARNGKQVAVVVELKARFDEAANIQFATRLEEFGIHVTYGVVGLKTHSKVILVVRQDYNGLRRYAHIGTGNYHPGTARFYADYGLLTCDGTIGEDLTELFNYLTTGYMPDRPYRKILPAPTVLKRALLARIEREIKLNSAASPGLIQFKMNALEDVDITRALYRASQAGVKVDLIVRDTCRLRPGIQGLSENVRVVSIVGRFLEHGRIFYFRNGGAEEFFIGSADCMKRNLESRVEVVAPVEDPQLRKELRIVLDLQLRPNRCQWEMQADGTYVRTTAADAAPACQQAMIDFAETRQTEATKVKKRRSKGFARRTVRERTGE